MHCSLRLGILYFLDYEVDEDLPWHSTISRPRQLYPTAVFEHVFVQCVAVGLVKGHIQAVDSAPVKANASFESLGEKQPMEASAPVLHVAGEPVMETLVAPPAALRASPEHHLRRVAFTQARHDSGPLGRNRLQTQLLSNETHYSFAAPDTAVRSNQGRPAPLTTWAIWLPSGPAAAV